MADEETTQPGAESEQVSPVVTEAEGETPAVEQEDFDKERAMATIKKLRGFEKQAKALQRQLDELKERDNNDATTLSDLQAQVNTLAAERATFEMKASTLEKAATVGFVHPEDAWKLVDTSKLELQEDGTVKGLEEELKNLAEKKPYLLRQAQVKAVNPAAGVGNREEQYRREYFGSPSEADDIFSGGGVVNFGAGKELGEGT